MCSQWPATGSYQIRMNRERREVFKIVLLKVQVFGNVTLCRIVNGHRSFVVLQCLNLQRQAGYERTVDDMAWFEAVRLFSVTNRSFTN